MFWRPQQPGVQPRSLLSSVPQHFGVQWLLGHGQQIPALMAALEERWGKAGLKGHLVATQNLLRQPGDTSMVSALPISLKPAHCTAMLGMPFPSSARKASTVAFLYPGMGNPPKQRKCSCILGNLLRGLPSHISPLTWNMHAKDKEATWLPPRLQEPCPSHQYGKLDCSTTPGRFPPKPPAQSPLQTSGGPAQHTRPWGFLAQWFSLLPPALQRAQDHVQLPFPRCCAQVLRPNHPTFQRQRSPTHAHHHLQCLKRRTCSL